MTAARAIRWSTIGAVSVVALVAAFVSYRHALQVVRVHGESGALAEAYPLTIDGLIYAASMVLLDAARRGIRAHWLAYAALALGIAATLAANVAAGLAYGPVGAVVAAWPAPALVISYELLMLVIRSSVAAPAVVLGGVTDDDQPLTTPVSPLTALAEPAEPVTHIETPAHFAFGHDGRVRATPAETGPAAVLAASIAAGNPLSQRQMMTRFALSRAAERTLRQAVLAQPSGHAPAEVPASTDEISRQAPGPGRKPAKQAPGPGSAPEGVHQA